MEMPVRYAVAIACVNRPTNEIGNAYPYGRGGTIFADARDAAVSVKSGKSSAVRGFLVRFNLTGVT